MEAISKVATQSGAAITSRRSATRLNAEELKFLLTLLEQTADRYPHQDLSIAMEGYLHDFEVLAIRYSLRLVMKSLGELRVRPGQRFFPQPSEVAEVIEEIMAKDKAQFLKDHPWHPCSRCDNGYVVVERDGRNVAERCQCWLNWRRSADAARPDAKAKGAGN